MSLEWTASTDDEPYQFNQVFANGAPNVDTGTSTSAVVQGLTPETSYILKVVARDFYGNNLSEPSNAIRVTTDASDPNDSEAPAPPGDLVGLSMRRE